MTFNGRILERGFWLYIWEIRFAKKKYIYVGRTGDSSSPNASSPFNRIGQHLDFKPKAKGNALARQLKKAGVEPKSSKFRMAAFGPIFKEQNSFESHKKYRDQMATLEYEIADLLRSKGFEVLGTHHKKAPVDRKRFTVIAEKILEFLNYQKR